MNKKGFTLIELLVVIAIIAILSAVIFPIMNSVHAKTQQSTCMNNMRQIGLALDMYHADNKKYPSGLAPDVKYDDDNNPIPMEELNGNLLENDYIPNYSVLHCPMDDRFEDTSGVCIVDYNLNNVNLSKKIYSYSSYEKYINDETIMDNGVYSDSSAVLSYNINWWKAREDDTTDNNYLRQLKWKNPPANTVVCWCMNHADNPYSADQVEYPTEGNTLVLFLDGHVEIYTDTISVADATWTIEPLN